MQYEQTHKTSSCSFGGYLMRGGSGLCNVNSPVLRRLPPLSRGILLSVKQLWFWEKCCLNTPAIQRGLLASRWGEAAVRVGSDGGTHLSLPGVCGNVGRETLWAFSSPCPLATLVWNGRSVGMDAIFFFRDWHSRNPLKQGKCCCYNMVVGAKETFLVYTNLRMWDWHGDFVVGSDVPIPPPKTYSLMSSTSCGDTSAGWSVFRLLPWLFPFSVLFSASFSTLDGNN